MRSILIALVVAPVAACVSTGGPDALYTSADFPHLRFLEGRWEGTGPDGTPFYEQYSFPSRDEMRSQRFPDAGFAQSQDGSVVALVDGRGVSTWNGFTWEASELVPGKACFTPVSAPGSFCWERISDDAAQVTQRWTDQNGQAQQDVVPLRRL